MRAGILFFFIIGVASASPVEVGQNSLSEQTQQNAIPTGEGFNLVETLLSDIMEEIRNIMKNGIGDIPPLDPITIDRIHVDESIVPLPGSFITLKNLKVAGVSDFKVDKLQFLEQSLMRYRLTLNLSIPTINVDTSSYDMMIRILGGEVFGTGDMKLRIVNFRVSTSFVMGLRITWNGIFPTIHECRVSLGLDSFEPTITGMFNNEGSSQFVSIFLRNLITELFEFFEEDITGFLSTTIQTVLNEILRDLNIGNLFPLSSESLAGAPEIY